MRVSEALARELRDLRALGNPRALVVQVRVTTDALYGSPVLVPITPERARTLARLVAIHNWDDSTYVVIADPGDYERAYEILLHPGDWVTLRTEPDVLATGTLSYDPRRSAGAWRAYGVPVNDG